VEFGLRHIVLPGRPDAVAESVVDGAGNPGWDTHEHGAGRYAQPFRDHGTRRDHAAGTDMDPVQEHAAHANEALILDRAAMEDDPVPDPHPSADRGRTPAST